MTPRLVFRPEAEAELLDARVWYEGERVGLGALFAAAVESTVTGILQSPRAFPGVKGDTRRALVRRCPYAVYFRPMDDEIIVLAALHGRRNPQHWRSRR